MSIFVYIGSTTKTSLQVYGEKAIFEHLKKYKISIIQAKDFLREIFLQLLYKCDDRENIKVYNLILNFIIRICNKSETLDSAKAEIIATGDNEIKKYFDKIA